LPARALAHLNLTPGEVSDQIRMPGACRGFALYDGGSWPGTVMIRPPSHQANPSITIAGPRADYQTGMAEWRHYA